MDVTPQELRDIEIRESFRGYHRDDVDELLERAAATIEHLEHQIRILQERLAAGPAPAPRREPEPQVAAVPAQVPGPVPAPVPVPVPDSDVIQRTLILAQRAADEAVAEAQAKAAQVTGDAEQKAQALVAEAESTARRIAETERRRMEAEIARLAETRDALNADVDTLEVFAAEYRDRIRRAIEAELLHLSASAANAEPLPERPALQTEGYELPAATIPAAPLPAAPLAPAAELAAPTPPPARPVEPEPTAAVPVVEPAPPVADASTPAWGTQPESAWSPEPAGGWSDAAATDDTWGGAQPAAAPPSEWGSESLDDDAFFASLRDAVRDDEPLGPRDSYDDLDDLDDPDGSRKLFRRRR